MSQTKRLVLVSCSLLLLGAIVLALDPWEHPDSSGSTVSAPPSILGRTGEKPSLRGATGPAQDDPPGDAGPGEAHPSTGDLHLSGIVTHASGPVQGATVRVTNNDRLGVPPLVLGRTGEDGRFRARVASRDLLEPSWVRLWAVVEHYGSLRTSAPLVRRAPESSRVDDLRLELLEGCRVRMRTVTRDGEPVARGHVLVAVFRPGVGTRMYTAAADEGGVAEIVLPYGNAKFRCRSPDGPFGPVVVEEIAAERVSYDVGDLIAPSRSIRVRIHVVDGEDAGVPGAWVRTSDHDSRFLHEQSPGDLVHLRADEDGNLLLPPMAPDVFPITVVAATPRYVPTAIEVTESVAAEGTPVRLALPERPGFDVRLELDGGGDVAEFPELAWTVVDSPGVGDPAGMGREVYPLALRSRDPLVRAHRDGTWSVYVAAEGPCSCQGMLPGGLTIDVTAEARAGARRPVVRAVCPPGRRVTARVVNASQGGPRAVSDLITARWLGAEGEALEHARPWAWTPREDSPDVELWAPTDAWYIRFQGVGSARAPWQPVTLPLGNGEALTLDLAAGAERGGTLRVRLGSESDPIEKQGAVVIVAPAGASSAMEWLRLSTSAEGACEVLLPPGFYYVGADGSSDPRETEVLPQRVTDIWVPQPEAR